MRIMRLCQLQIRSHVHTITIFSNLRPRSKLSLCLSFCCMAKWSIWFWFTYTWSCNGIANHMARAGNRSDENNTEQLTSICNTILCYVIMIVRPVHIRKRGDFFDSRWPIINMICCQHQSHNNSFISIRLHRSRQQKCTQTMTERMPDALEESETNVFTQRGTDERGCREENKRRVSF